MAELSVFFLALPEAAVGTAAFFAAGVGEASAAFFLFDPETGATEETKLAFFLLLPETAAEAEEDAAAAGGLDRTEADAGRKSEGLLGLAAGTAVALEGVRGVALPAAAPMLLLLAEPTSFFFTEETFGEAAGGEAEGVAALVGVAAAAVEGRAVRGDFSPADADERRRAVVGGGTAAAAEGAAAAGLRLRSLLGARTAAEEGRAVALPGESGPRSFEAVRGAAVTSRAVARPRALAGAAASAAIAAEDGRTRGVAGDAAAAAAAGGDEDGAPAGLVTTFFLAEVMRLGVAAAGSAGAAAATGSSAAAPPGFGMRLADAVAVAGRLMATLGMALGDCNSDRGAVVVDTPTFLVAESPLLLPAAADPAIFVLRGVALPAALDMATDWWLNRASRVCVCVFVRDQSIDREVVVITSA